MQPLPAFLDLLVVLNIYKIWHCLIEVSAIQFWRGNNNRGNSFEDIKEGKDPKVNSEKETEKLTENSQADDKEQKGKAKGKGERKKSNHHRARTDDPRVISTML